MRGERRPAKRSRGITAQRQNILDPRLRIPIEDRAEFGFTVTYTGQMRYRGQIRFALDAHDQIMRSFARRSSSAIGHRYKRRFQFLKPRDGLK